MTDYWVVMVKYRNGRFLSTAFVGIGLLPDSWSLREFGNSLQFSTMLEASVLGTQVREYYEKNHLSHEVSVMSQDDLIAHMVGNEFSIIAEEQK